jgi:hypothetical protein
MLRLCFKYKAINIKAQNFLKCKKDMLLYPKKLMGSVLALTE